MHTEVSIGLAGCAKAPPPPPLGVPLKMPLRLELGCVELDVDDEMLLFNELGFVPPPPPAHMPPKPTVAAPAAITRCCWVFRIFGADVLRPREVLGMAGLIKRSLVRRPYVCDKRLK